MSKASGSLPPDDPLFAPGLKRRTRKGSDARYFIVPPKDVAAGYQVNIRTIPKNATEAEAAELCRSWWADLAAWRDGRPKPVNYTFRWLIGRYKNDRLSPFHAKAPATQQNYKYELAALDESIGHLRFDPLEGQSGSRIVGENIREWHHGWGCPVTQKDERGKDVEVASAPSRAIHLIKMLRTIVSYGVEIGAPGAGDLRMRLSAMTFNSPPARTKAPTYEQVDAIVNKAVELGWRSIAITTLAQYELIERRTHIIGQWVDGEWSRGWVWDGEVMIGGQAQRVGVTPEWVIRYFQTKRGHNLREYDLKPVQRLLGLMQETPKEARTGAIIICEATGLPWTKRYYQEIFRDVAQKAGVPDDVWSMDMRSGGATEADSIPEITDRMFDDAGGWADPKMKNRYRRNKQRNAGKVVELRQAMRPKP